MAFSQRKVLLVCGNLSVPMVLENPEYTLKRHIQPPHGSSSPASLQEEEPPVSILGFTSLQAVACYPVNHDKDSGVSSITYLRPALESELNRNDPAAVVKRSYSIVSGLVAAMVGVSETWKERVHSEERWSFLGPLTYLCALCLLQCEYVGVATFGLSDEPAVLLWPVRVVDGTDACR